MEHLGIIDNWGFTKTYTMVIDDIQSHDSWRFLLSSGGTPGYHVSDVSDVPAPFSMLIKFCGYHHDEKAEKFAEFATSWFTLKLAPEHLQTLQKTDDIMGKSPKIATIYMEVS